MQCSQQPGKVVSTFICTHHSDVDLSNNTHKRSTGWLVLCAFIRKFYMLLAMSSITWSSKALGLRNHWFHKWSHGLTRLATNHWNQVTLPGVILVLNNVCVSKQEWMEWGDWESVTMTAIENEMHEGWARTYRRLQTNKIAFLTRRPDNFCLGLVSAIICLSIFAKSTPPVNAIIIQHPLYMAIWIIQYPSYVVIPIIQYPWYIVITTNLVSLLYSNLNPYSTK